MDKPTMKRGDTRPLLRLTLWDEEATPRVPFDLTQALTVHVWIRHAASGAAILSGVAFTKEGGGTVSHELTPEQSSSLRDGLHHVEARVTWADAGVQTVPSLGVATFYVEPRLG